GCEVKPRIYREGSNYGVLADHVSLGRFRMFADHGPTDPSPAMLFTENETNSQLLFDEPTYTPYVKDAFHRYLIHGERDAVDPALRGTKVAWHYPLTIPAGGELSIRLRL